MDVRCVSDFAHRAFDNGVGLHAIYMGVGPSCSGMSVGQVGVTVQGRWAQQFGNCFTIVVVPSRSLPASSFMK